MNPTSLNRRQFLSKLGKSTAGVAFWSAFWQNPSEVVGADVATIPATSKTIDPNRLVILSDTHCGVGLKHQLDFFRKSVADILALEARPAHVLIYGDFAFLYGKKADYELIRTLIAPLDAADIPWTTCMGNHDRREYFAEVFPEQAKKSLLTDRLVFRVETPHVDFLLLDSLNQPQEETRWITPGEILSDQREWLHEALKMQTKPVVLGAHHALGETQLVDIIKEHTCVAGYINGHHHYWQSSEFEGVPALTLPSNGHWGDIGFVTATLSAKEAHFQLTMRDYLLPNKAPDFKANPDREKIIAEKQGAVWRLDLA